MRLLFARFRVTAGGLLLVLLTSFLFALSIASDVLQLSENVAAWIIVAAVALIAGLIFLAARPLLRKNLRGEWLVRVVGDVGLFDVENRRVAGKRLPPQQILKRKHLDSVLISGVLDQLFQRYRDDVRRFVESGGRINVMLIHPERVRSALDTCWAGRDSAWKTYWVTNCNEAQVAVDAIIEARLDMAEGFQLRFMVDLPPFLGILALDSNRLADASLRSFVRVQPMTVSDWIGRGTVFTFRNLVGMKESPFMYFAHDLEEQWRVAIDDQEYLYRRRHELAG